MNFDWKRWKVLDYVVLAICVLAWIGIGLTWWKVDLGGAADAALGQAGINQEDLGGLGLGLDAAVAQAFATVDVGIDGVDFDSIAFCLALTVILFVIVLAKPLLPVNKAVPKWYAEALVVMVFGGIITLITVLRLAVAPEGGHSYWAPGAGGFVTLIAALLMLGVGYMMWRDKSGDFGPSTLPKIPLTTNTSGGSSTPPSGGTPPAGNPPAAQ